MVAATTILAIIIIWSAFSGPLDRRGITSALFLTVAGFLVGGSVLGLLDISVESAVVERVAELALVLLLAVALVAYTIALTLGGSGFIAAFVGGLAFGRVSGAHASIVTLFAEETGGLLAAVTWIGCGALALTLVLPNITWQVVLYAALSLTVVRTIPVAIAFAGQGVKRPTVAFIGWFGPRGLASLVFALLALERGVPEGEVVLTTVVVTVALSVVLHGLTSVPLVAAYHRWHEGHTAEHPVTAEATPSTMPRRRPTFHYRSRALSGVATASGSSAPGGTR